MQTGELDELKILCSNIRKSIELTQFQTSLLKYFPKGCCRDASIIIAEIIKEKGFEGVFYCNREIDEYFVSHAWLEYRTYILDLTADQFGDQFEKVIVIPKAEATILYKSINREFCNLQIAGVDVCNVIKDLDIIKSELFRSQCHKVCNL